MLKKNKSGKKYAESSVRKNTAIPLWLCLMMLSVGGLAVIMLLMYVVTFGLAVSNKQDVWGQFGDFFGGILNPLLSSLALAAVLVTMRMQGRELREAQEENRQTNKHLNDQARYIRLQSFESVFFRLLDLHLSAKKEFQYAEGEKLKAGLAGFECAGDELGRHELYLVSRVPISKEDLVKSLPGFTERFELYFGNSLSTYCRSMYQILKYVDTYEGFEMHSTMVGSVGNIAKCRAEYLAKRQYINMLRSQMEQVERRAIFSSCLTTKGLGLKYYVEKYSLLKGINFDRMGVSRAQAECFYDRAAFSSSEDIDPGWLIDNYAE